MSFGAERGALPCFVIRTLLQGGTQCNSPKGSCTYIPRHVKLATPSVTPSRSPSDCQASIMLAFISPPPVYPQPSMGCRVCRDKSDKVPTARVPHREGRRMGMRELSWRSFPLGREHLGLLSPASG